MIKLNLVLMWFFTLLLEFTVGMILPKKDNVKENISNITSGFNAKVSIRMIYVKYIICIRFKNFSNHFINNYYRCK